MYLKLQTNKRGEFDSDTFQSSLVVSSGKVETCIKETPGPKRLE